MKFIALLPVRDEADIIGQCLAQMLTWADAIYVFDTGSVDSTWEIVQDFASKDKRVIPLKKDPVYFSETLLRGWLFHQARQKMRDGDWFLRVDADEFHHISPKKFVETHLRPHETIVYHQYYDFRLLQSEVENWESGRETVADRARPIADRRRWFTPSIYSEPRLCRYRETMQWPPAVSFPYNAGYVARERLPIRHYPHRDPEQLRRRCLLRAFMIALNSSQLFTGYSSDDIQRLSELTSQVDKNQVEAEWRKFITSDDLPGMQHWHDGTDLPGFHFTNHLRPARIRFTQRILHGLLLPMLDACRNRWPADTYPLKIPQEITARLAIELK